MFKKNVFFTNVSIHLPHALVQQDEMVVICRSVTECCTGGFSEPYIFIKLGRLALLSFHKQSLNTTIHVVLLYHKLIVLSFG